MKFLVERTFYLKGPNKIIFFEHIPVEYQRRIRPKNIARRMNKTEDRNKTTLLFVTVSDNNSTYIQKPDIPMF